jgi:hypothetical protein
MMIRAGDRVPHFVVRTTDGSDVRYADLWKQRLLLLLALPDRPAPDQDAYVHAVRTSVSGLSTGDVAVIATRDGLAWLVAPAVLVADRWGEVLTVAAGARIEDLPSPADLVDWLRYAEHQCPECEGEAR